MIDADAIRGRYGLTTANGVRTTSDADSPYDGIWANQVVLGDGNTVSAWDFRNAYGLPAPGFELIPVRRTLTGSGGFAFIGDSVGVGVTDGAASDFRVLTEGVFSTARFDALVNRRTQGGTVGDGVQAASKVAVGTDLAVVELGYNDNPPDMPARIDAVMGVLRRRGVDMVAWVTLSERRPEFAATNAAIRAAADRWSEMVVLDWESHSDHRGGARWFADDVHLTATGRAEFSWWLRDQVVTLLADGYTPPRPLAPGVPLHVPVAGVSGVSAAAGSGVVGVALNVSAVAADGAGWLRVWPCGADEPVTAAVSYVAGEVATNAVVVPVDDTGEVCVSSWVGTDVVVDLGGWFDAGVRSAQGRLVDTRDAKRLRAGRVLRVPAVGVSGMPGSGVVGVALNVSAVAADGAGWLRVWPCGADEPVTAAVSYVAGEVATNAVVVPVDDTGEVCVSSRVGTDVVVDLGGWFDAGVRSAQGRLVDTRDAKRLRAGRVLRVPAVGVSGMPGSGVVGVALNVSAVAADGAGWLRVWPCGADEPVTAAVSYVAGEVATNAVVVPVDDTGEVCVSSRVGTDVVVDLGGWFDAGVRSAQGRLVDTRYGIGPVPGR